MSRTYVYIDGESHYLRSEKACQKVHGPTAQLSSLKVAGTSNEQMLLVLPAAKVFWSRHLSPGAVRAYYFTCAAVDDPEHYRIQVALRNVGLEPHVHKERSALARQRENELKNHGLIEKAKTVDVALTVRMLEDSDRQFDVCHLYTSDIDFLPLIQAVRGRGKQVYVYGYVDGISSQSPFLHACDGFTDLGLVLAQQFELNTEERG